MFAYIERKERMNNSVVDDLVKKIILENSRTCFRCGLLSPMTLTGTWYCSRCGLYWRYLNSNPLMFQYALAADHRWVDVPWGSLLVVESKEEA